MPIGLVFGLLASVGWGIVDVSAAMSTRHVGSLRVLVGSQAVSIAVLLVVVIARPDLLGPDPMAGILVSLPLGLLAALAYLAYFTALRMGPVSIVSPVIVAYGGATVVLAIVFRGETLTTQQGAGAVLGTLGVVLAAVTFNGSLRGMRMVGPGVAVAVLTLVGFAVLTLLLADPIIAYGWLPVVIGSRIANNAASMLMLGLALRSPSVRVRPLLEPFSGWTWTPVVLIVIGGASDIIAFSMYAFGLGVAPVWMVGLASSFGPVLAVVYGVWALHERPRATQWAGLALIALGVVVLALAV